MRPIFYLFLVYFQCSYSNEKDFTYKIKEGDTMFSIAQICKVKTANLMLYNKIKDSDFVKIGQEIKIPKNYEANCKELLIKKNSKEIQKDNKNKEELKKVDKLNEIKIEKKDLIQNKPTKKTEEKIEKPANESKAIAPLLKDVNFERKTDKCSLFKIDNKPMEGEIYDTFGTESIYSTGIVIKTDKDMSSVKSVEDGRVIFKGKNVSINNESSKLIIISHKDNYFTGYGIISDDIFIKEGDRVKKGQIIANLDITKDVNLFFTIRTKDGLICNPLNIIKR